LHDFGQAPPTLLARPAGPDAYARTLT